jgi:import receptor subunit TOM22
MKINEIKPKSKDKNKSSKQSLRTDAEYVSDDDDGKVYSDADEYLDAEEEDIENETFWQRIQALADIFPEHKRAEYSEKIQNYGVSAWKAAKFTGNIAWILTTSAMVLAVPLMFEIEREQSMLQWEKEQQQLQKQGAQQVSIFY